MTAQILSYNFAALLTGLPSWTDIVSNWPPIITIITLPLTIFLACLSVFLNRKDRRPCWATTTNVLIMGYTTKFSGLQVTYNNQPIQNLSMTRIVFWNAGRIDIDKYDLDTSNPLRIHAYGNTDMLDANVLVTNQPSSLFTVAISNDHKDATLKFDFLRRDAGAVIQVLHTGVNLNSVWLVGEIKNVSKLRYRAITRESLHRTSGHLKLRLRKHSIPLGFGRLSLILVSLWIAIGWAIAPFGIGPPIKVRLELTAALLLILLLPTVVLLVLTRSSPQGLELFEEDVFAEFLSPESQPTRST